MAEEILLATEKTPNTRKIRIEKTGVLLNENNVIIVNKNFQTSNKNIFVIGDVTNAPLRIEATAGREGTYAAENILERTEVSIDYNAVSYTILTDRNLLVLRVDRKRTNTTNEDLCVPHCIFSDMPKAIIMRKYRRSNKNDNTSENKINSWCSYSWRDCCINY